MISIKNLEKHFKDLPVLNKISFNIRSGSIVGLVGPNGAGKSTLINILCGVLRKTIGQITILDLDLQKYPKKIKQQIGVMPENHAVFEGLTGEEQLSFTAEVFGLKREVYLSRIFELLRYLEIEYAKDRLIKTYSQGMKKKIAFASAIIHRPKVLLLDEPFENIDPISRTKMKKALKKMRDIGTTILISSHALAEVEDFCDEVVIINKGEMIFQAPTEFIREHIKDTTENETYQSLEEIFIDLTDESESTEISLSWL